MNKHRTIALVVLAVLAVVAVVASFLIAGAITSKAATGFVTKSGTQLTLDGHPYKFDGFNMYYLNGRNNCGPTYSDAQVDASFSNRVGNATRAWFFEHEAVSNGTIDWSMFDRTLNIAAQHNIKVVVTLGNEWADCVASGKKTAGWYSTGYKSLDGDGPLSYRDWVSAVVRRYASNPTVLAWQMMNEAEAPSSTGCTEATGATALRSFADDIGGLIHSIDPNHLVSLGTMGSGQCGAQGGDYKTVHASPGVDLCEYHDYNSPTVAMPGDQYNGLQARLTQCAALGKPLFVGETGITESSVGSYTARTAAYNNKFAAQYAAGVVGELIWSWSLNGSGTGWDVGPPDMTLLLMPRYEVG